MDDSYSLARRFVWPTAEEPFEALFNALHGSRDLSFYDADVAAYFGALFISMCMLLPSGEVGRHFQLDHVHVELLVDDALADFRTPSEHQPESSSSGSAGTSASK